MSQRTHANNTTMFLKAHKGILNALPVGKVFLGNVDEKFNTLNARRKSNR